MVKEKKEKKNGRYGIYRFSDDQPQVPYTGLAFEDDIVICHLKPANVTVLFHNQTAWNFCFEAIKWLINQLVWSSAAVYILIWAL